MAKPQSQEADFPPTMRPEQGSGCLLILGRSQELGINETFFYTSDAVNYC